MNALTKEERDTVDALKERWAAGDNYTAGFEAGALMNIIDRLAVQEPPAENQPTRAELAQGRGALAEGELPAAAFPMRPAQGHAFIEEMQGGMKRIASWAHNGQTKDPGQKFSCLLRIYEEAKRLVAQPRALEESVEWPDPAPWTLQSSDGGKFNRRGRVIRFATKEAALKWKRKNIPQGESDTIYVPVNGDQDMTASPPPQPPSHKESEPHSAFNEAASFTEKDQPELFKTMNQGFVSPLPTLEPKGIEPVQADVGRSVVYRTAPQYLPEEGVITSFNASTVFVRYTGKTYSQATSRCDLDWSHKHKSGSLSATGCGEG